MGNGGTEQNPKSEKELKAVTGGTGSDDFMNVLMSLVYNVKLLDDTMKAYISAHPKQEHALNEAYEYFRSFYAAMSNAKGFDDFIIMKMNWEQMRIRLELANADEILSSAYYINTKELIYSH